MGVIGLRCTVLTWPARVRSQLGYHTGADARHYARLSGGDNLELFAELNSLPRNEASHRLADLTGVLGQGEPLDRQVRTLSTGNTAHSHVRIDELKLRALIAQFF